MKTLLIALALSLAAGVSALAMSGTAGASHVKVEIEAPTQIAAGQTADVRAVFTSAGTGAPVAGAKVTFLLDTSFAGVSGQAVLGEAVTDKDGVAGIEYTPRSAGEHQIVVRYLAPGSSEPEEASWAHKVAAPGQQLYRSTAGIRIPGLNSWLLMATVSTVWAILLSVAVRVIAIARAGVEAEGKQMSSVRFRQQAPQGR